MVAAEPQEPPQGRTRPDRPPRGAQGAFKRTAQELRLHVARLGPQRVAELLNVRMCDLGAIIDGRVDVAKDALKRVRAAEA